MTRILVIQGAGMDRRGKEQVEIFGSETLDEINAQIMREAAALGMEVELFQSNDEDLVVKKLIDTDPGEFAALLINPGGFTMTKGPLPETIGQLGFPAYEIHASNPSARKVQSTLQPHCKGSICGFGYVGYRMAMQVIRDLEMEVNSP